LAFNKDYLTVNCEQSRTTRSRRTVTVTYKIGPISASDDVHKLKLLIYAKFNIPPNEQQIHYKEKVLDKDNMPLSNWEVIPSHPLDLIHIEPIEQDAVYCEESSGVGFTNTKLAKKKFDSTEPQEEKKEWACTACTFLNDPEHLSCIICAKTRENNTAPKRRPESPNNEDESPTKRPRTTKTFVID